MGNIQCSKCGLPAAHYDYDPNKMKKIEFIAKSKIQLENKQIQNKLNHFLFKGINVR